MTKYLLATLFVWFGLHTIYAQTYYFDKYSVRDGLAQSKVMSSYQDKNGNLWLGTTSGVSSFDGRRFINYTMVDGLAEGGVQAIIADSLGNIWFGHTGGALSVKIGDKITAVELKGVKIHSDITDLLVDRYQNLWITTESNGVVRLSNLGQHLKKATHYTSKEGISDRVFKVTETSKGEIYFIIEGGIKLYDYDTNNFSFFTLEGLPKYFQITELMEDTKGNMWFGTYNGGLYCYEAAQKKIAIYDVRDGLAHNWITSLAEAEDGAIWVGTFGGGISRIRNKVIKTFNEQNGLADNKIRSVMPDREGNLVICTQEHGMLIFKGEQFVHYGANFQLNSQVNAILEDSQGKLWFGTNDGLLLYDPIKGTKKHFTIADGLLSTTVISVKEDKNGDVWVGTQNGGAVKFNPKRQSFEYVPRLNPSDRTTIRALEIDKKNNSAWLGTLDGIVYYEIDKNTFTYLTQSWGLAGNEIKSLYADSKGRVWIGSVNKGITLVDGTKFTILKPNKELQIGARGYTPTCFAEDKTGGIWIGTQDDGLLYYDGKAISKQIRMENGLLANYITALMVDNNNNLWIGASTGLNQLETRTGKIHLYNEKNGFTGIEVKPNAIFKDKQGNMWFGTVQGATKFNAALETHLQLEPLTRIAHLRVNLRDRDVPPSGVKLIMSYKEHAVYISYSAVWLTNPESVSYRFMLDGLDTTWQAETQQTEMNYPYLKPGTYTFKLIAKNHEGTWNSVPSSIQFTIEPPFWQTPWFILSVIVLLVVSIYGFILWRERNHRLERIKLEQTVNERTWELAQKNDELAARNNDIMDSIRYAKRIQTAVMPTTQTFEQYLPEHFVFFRPRDIVSGDYYWLGRMGNRTLFTAVDCTGHGVPGAFLSMLGIAFLNEIVSRNPEMTAADILGQLRAQIISSLKQTGQAGGSQDGMDMALCIIDEQSHTVQFSGANNPLLLYRNDEEALMYKADKMPIGIYQGGQREFTNHTINYQTGDTVYVFSDGYPDQFGEKTNRKYMRKRFKEFLQTIQSYDMQRQQQLIVTEFDSWKGTRDQIDDVLVIGVRL